MITDLDNRCDRDLLMSMIRGNTLIGDSAVMEVLADRVALEAYGKDIPHVVACDIRDAAFVLANAAYQLDPEWFRLNCPCREQHGLDLCDEADQ